jgi:hypothetical protein
MAIRSPQPLRALKYEATVHKNGRVEVVVPFAQGERVTVSVIPETRGNDQDLVAAAASSLAFWDNPFDDADWNNA